MPNLPHPASRRTDPEPGKATGWIAVARLLRPQGRRGEILADPLSGQHEIFAPGQSFRLVRSVSAGAEKALETTVTLESAWQPQGRKANRLVLKLVGCNSISDAEQLEGADLHLEESALPTLGDDTFLVRDLLGCTLLDGDRALGTITDLQFPIAADGHTRLPDAPDLLVVEPLAQKTPDSASPDTVAAIGDDTDPDTILVPFVKAWLLEVDLAGKRLRMDLPPGLFD